MPDIVLRSTACIPTEPRNLKFIKDNSVLLKRLTFARLTIKIVGMSNITNNNKFKVESAVLCDAVSFEGGVKLFDDERGAAVAVNGMHKCVFADVRDFFEYADKYGLYGKVCLLGAPLSATKTLGFSAEPCKTYAYFCAMPPELDLSSGVEIKRLAPTLAETVLSRYHNPGGGYTVEKLATVMREKGVFGAIADGALAGFIGRHRDGSMGMLEVSEQFQKRGIGSALERFLINYVMTFGRVPYCDVFDDNDVSMKLQRRLGLTESCGYTFWGEILQKTA